MEPLHCVLSKVRDIPKPLIPSKRVSVQQQKIDVLSHNSSRITANPSRRLTSDDIDLRRRMSSLDLIAAIEQCFSKQTALLRGEKEVTAQAQSALAVVKHRHSQVEDDLNNLRIVLVRTLS